MKKKKKYALSETDVLVLSEEIYLKPENFLAAAVLVKAGKDIPERMKQEGFHEMPVKVDHLDTVNQIGMYAAFGLQLYLLQDIDPSYVPPKSRKKVQKLLDAFEADLPWFAEFERNAGETFADPDKSGDDEFGVITDALFHLGWCISLGLITTMDIDPQTTSMRIIMEQLEAEIEDADHAVQRKLN